MHIDKDVELIDGLPIAYIKSIDALVAADLHLGYESHMAKNGVFIPKVNLKRILADLGKGIRASGAKSIIVVGDIKNEFSGVEQDEFNELYDLVRFCKEKKLELTLIKGNHDNFIDRYKGRFMFRSHSSEAQIGDYLFFHGDRLPNIPKSKPAMLVLGHEHPTIGVVNAAGRMERLRCFILGRYKGVKALVLPAISYFATGSSINMQSSENMLSPVLRDMDLKKAHAIAIGYGSTLDFGTIGDLRKLNHR